MKNRAFGHAVAAVFGLSMLLISPAAMATPPPTCSRVIIVLDESGSIDAHETTVRSGVNAFLSGLPDSGLEAAVVEFGTSAKLVFGYTPLDPTSLAATFGPYIDATASGDVYDAPSQLGQYTNWDDALDQASEVNASGLAPLVLFLTDGDPTAYNLDHSGEPGTTLVSGITAEAVNRAVAEAEEIRAAGSQVLAIGVGAALTNPASLARLQQVAGPDIYSGTGTLELATTDVVLVPEFADLPAMMELVAQAMCADPAISVEKSVDQPAVTASTSVTYEVIVTNTGNVPLSNVELTDEAVPDCSLVIGDLAVGESVTVTCDSVVWAPLTNTAEATGEDPFGTPVDDDDSAEVTLIPTGTGTPGYWRNHPSVWPVAGDLVLIGDWNHNQMCDPSEVCLSLSREEAMAALTTPPRGDMTWNLARPLVAAWLNVSTGNDSFCVTEAIDAAVAWLTDHPLGSGVEGGDPAWAEASPWANLLDQYNNGNLCAESRDRFEGDESRDRLEGDESATQFPVQLPSLNSPPGITPPPSSSANRLPEHSQAGHNNSDSRGKHPRP